MPELSEAVKVTVKVFFVVVPKTTPLPPLTTTLEISVSPWVTSVGDFTVFG